MTNYEKIKRICDKNNGIITASMAANEKIASWYLTDMVERKQLIRVARGIYLTEGGDQDDYYFFQVKNRRCIYSFSSALYLHGMTDRVPFSKEVTVYKGYNSSHITDDTIIHYVDKSLYEIGVTECSTVFGNAVRAYDKERTICDLIANRKNIDVEVFSKAVKNYASDPERDYRKLRKYARMMKISERVDSILEVL